MFIFALNKLPFENNNGDFAEHFHVPLKKADQFYDFLVDSLFTFSLFISRRYGDMFSGTLLQAFFVKNETAARRFN